MRRKSRDWYRALIRDHWLWRLQPSEATVFCRQGNKLEGRGRMVLYSLSPTDQTHCPLFQHGEERKGNRTFYHRHIPREREKGFSRHYSQLQQHQSRAKHDGNRGHRQREETIAEISVTAWQYKLISCLFTKIEPFQMNFRQKWQRFGLYWGFFQQACIVHSLNCLIFVHNRNPLKN